MQRSSPPVVGVGRSLQEDEQLKRPIDSCGIPVKGTVPVDRKELHPADPLLLVRFPEVCLQQAERGTPEVIHCREKKGVYSIDLKCVGSDNCLCVLNV